MQAGPGCRPEESLATLDGKNINGTWRLRIYDDSTGDTGALSSWGLILCGAPATTADGGLVYNGAVNDGNNDYGLEDVDVYGTTTMHGPVRVKAGPTLRVKP